MIKNKFLEWMNQCGKPYLVAGPCSAENLNQLLITAKDIAAHYPNAVLRAGVWKPRTRPDNFEGAGNIALDWLEEVKQQTNLRIAIEVATPAHVEAALTKGIDMFWIGARTVVNPFSVQAIADVLKGVDIPVMIKNPIYPDLNLWIGAIERIQKAGITKVAAVHRGFHQYGKTKFRNEPCWEIPIQLKSTFTDMAMFCDPSHITGNPQLIPYIAQRAMDLDMDGLMIETHYNPAKALSDATQQVTPLQLHDILLKLNISKGESEESDTNNELILLRKNIDKIDDELIQLIAERMNISKKIGQYKRENNITILQIRRWKKTLKNQLKDGASLGLDDDFVKLLYQLIHDESIKIQSEEKNVKSNKKSKVA